MEGKRIIGVDFDDVLYDCNSALAQFHNERYGTSYIRDDIRHHQLEKIWKCSREEAIRRVLEFYSSPHHDAAAPMTGAQETTDTLAEKFEFVIVTARPEHVREKTLAWLEKHFPGVFKKVIFVDHLHPDAPRHMTKRDACQEHGIEVFIEDAMHHAESVAETGIPVLLFHSPWNEDHEIRASNITRTHSWQDILERLLTIFPAR